MVQPEAVAELFGKCREFCIPTALEVDPPAGLQAGGGLRAVENEPSSELASPAIGRL